MDGDLDGLERSRRAASLVTVVGTCIDSGGEKRLLRLGRWNEKSEVAWTEFGRNLIERHLRLANEEGRPFTLAPERLEDGVAGQLLNLYVA